MQRSENKEETHRPTSGTFVMPRILRTAPNGDVRVTLSCMNYIMRRFGS
jgi:hypothetical protein